MADTTHLQLPLLAAAQAQKHVTHNEALLRLDALVQMSVIDRGLTVPPANPADGDRYIPASGASGAWATWDLNIAWFVDGVWTKLVPREGWRVWVEDEDVLLVWEGAAWVAMTGGNLAGPAGSAPNEVALFDGTTGKLVKRPGTSHMLPSAGTTAQRPTTPPAHAMRFNTDHGRLEIWDGAKWLQFRPDGLKPLTAGDTPTWHETDQLIIAAGAYATIFDLAGAVELLGGSIHSMTPGFRLTIDGTVVANRIADARGQNGGGQVFGAVSLPPARASSGMKLEAYNVSGADRVFGWRIATR